MKKSETTVVITSISAPSAILNSISQTAETHGADFILIGDRKSPSGFQLKGCDYFDVSGQSRLPFNYSKLCPENHYARKNIGYLESMRRGSSMIWETDDDNIPTDNFCFSRSETITGRRVSSPGWCNVYALYCDEKIWPRGLPLGHISRADPALSEEISCSSPIQQGLANSNPDVDAIYRYVGNLPVQFDDLESPVVLDKGVWCPFNSQNTTWYRRVFPLLYLPAHCSFRMTDIWRGFIAQRILWTVDGRLSFHNADVYQERNEHDLLKDFKDEIPGYLGNSAIKGLLEDLPLKSGDEHMIDNLQICYKALISNGYIGAEETKLLDGWLLDLDTYF